MSTEKIIVSKKGKLAVANEEMRAKHYSKALSLYEAAAAELGPNMPEALRAFISHCLARCQEELEKSGEGHATTTHRMRNPVIMLVNASHAHGAEVAFWSEFTKQMVVGRHAVVDLAFRKSEPFPETRMIIHPARMVDLAKRLQPYSGLDMPGWSTPELVDLYTDWEHRRWQLQKYSPEVRQGCINVIKYIDHVVKALNPVAILTTNKIDPPNNFAYLAAKNYGLEYRFLERSPLNTYIMERSGMFTESETVEDIISELLYGSKARLQNAKRKEQLLADILGNPYGFRAEEANTKQWVRGEGDRRPLFFLPLDNTLWTGWAQAEHPQGDVDYPVYRSPEEAIHELSLAVIQLGGVLLVKPHPSCKEWPRIRTSVPSVEFTELDLDQLCSEADVIVTFLTKVSYLGLAKCKPVVSFGGGLLDHLGVTYHVKARAELHDKLTAALAKYRLEEKVNRFIDLLPRLERRFFSNGEIAANSLLEEVDRYSLSCNEIDPAAIIENALSKLPIFKKNIVSPWLKAVQKSQCTVVFDVSRLLSSALRKSGVSRYIEEIVTRLKSDLRLNITFAYQPRINDYGLSGLVFSQLQRDLQIELVPMSTALAEIDAIDKPYIFHSPIDPLPSQDKHLNMHRVITIHDIFHLTHPQFYKRGNYITQSIINSIDIERDGIIFVSNYSRQDYELYIGKRIANATVIHEAAHSTFMRTTTYDTGTMLDQLQTKCEIVCFSCQGDPRKGFSRMLKIAKMWLQGDESRRVVVFGPSRNLHIVEQSLMEWSTALAARVLYLSDMSDEQLAAVYRRSVVQLYLSEAEGFGLPPLEAMACGCPSILLSNTALSEVYREWEYLLDATTSDGEILDTLDQLCHRMANGDNLRSIAQAFSKRYSWDTAADKTIEFYVRQLL